MARKRTVGYVQLEWTCPNCSTRNPGGNKTCQNCGAPQPENVQFERAADEKLVTDENALKAARGGADYICPYCSTRNRGDAKVCTQCGGDLVEAKRRAAGAELQRNEGPKEVTCTNCGTANPAASVNCSKCGAPLPRFVSPVLAATANARTVPPGSPSAKKKTNWPLIGGIAGGLLLCCLAVLFLFVFPSKSLEAQVQQVHWETSVPVQAQDEVFYSNQAGSPPSGAYDVSCHTESEQVCEERTIDQGNGYAEVVEECHNESAEYCSYSVIEWQTIQTYTLDGDNLFPVYADPNFSSGQRLGSASDEFTVYFTTELGQKTYSPDDLSEFQQFQIGSTWTLKLNSLGTIVSVER